MARLTFIRSKTSIWQREKQLNKYQYLQWKKSTAKDDLSKVDNEIAKLKVKYDLNMKYENENNGDMFLKAQEHGVMVQVFLTWYFLLMVFLVRLTPDPEPVKV